MNMAPHLESRRLRVAKLAFLRSNASWLARGKLRAKT
jgi:hypothetical protein